LTIVTLPVILKRENREAILGDWFQRKGELSWVFLS
jgi:hypothetical protein